MLPSSVHDVALEVAPALLLVTGSLSLKGLENLVMVLMRRQAQAEVEACSRDDSHQGLNGRLPAARFIGSHNGLGDAQSVGELPLGEPSLQSSRENEAAGNGWTLEKARSHVVIITDRL